MYSKKLESIFTKDTLLFALKNYQKAKDHDMVLSLINSGMFVKTLLKGFIPDPVRSFEIEKNENEKRQLALSSTSSKIVQKILVNELENLVKFSDRSYAYRKNKGTVKAINRTKDFLHKNFWVAKADIDNFFDTIDQQKLISKLNTHIQDKRIIKLIALFLKNGMLKNNEWVDKHRGVYQGDNLSPWLSNFYLNDFDHYLESKHISFVRYADDMLFFAKHKRDVIKILDLAEGFLNSLSLTFGKDKSFISNKKNGFAYLGLWFKNDKIYMDNKKLQKKISKLSQKTKKRPFSASIEVINEHISGVQRYYAKVLNDTSQFDILQKHIDDILIKKIVEAKNSKKINKKSKFLQLLYDLKSYQPLTQEQRQKHAHTLVAKAYEQIALKTPLKTAQKEINKSKTSYLKESIKSSEIILSKFGLYAGVTKGKVIVKEYGKIVKQLPLNSVTRIIILSPGINISSMLIYQCSKRNIDIDFIYKDEPYALITYYKSVSNALHKQQIELVGSKRSLKIAKTIIKSKTKNQLNLIKYFARYREDTDFEEFVKLEKIITTIEKLHKQIDNAQDTNALMGYEGSISNHYWSAFGILIDRPDFIRSTQNAPDAINQAINYGYGFLYNRIQSAIIKSGLSLYHSFLHKEQSGKPTLVYDLIEEFRQPVVDREIISIINRGTQIDSSKGRLTKQSVKVISQNIQERLITPTKWRKGKYKITTIIDEQVLSISHVVQNESKKYKGFLARY